MAQAAQRGRVAQLDRFVEMSLFYISGALLIAVGSTVFYNVIARYFFNSPAIWSEDVPRVFYLWMTFLAVAVATKRGENIRVTAIINKLAPMPRLVLELIMHVLVLMMIGTMIWFNFPILQMDLHGTMYSTGWSNIVRTLPLSVGGVFILFYQASLVFRSLREYRSGAPLEVGPDELLPGG